MRDIRENLEGSVLQIASQGNQTQTWSLSLWVWFVPEEYVPQSAVPPILKD